jgi:hypothetical protein
LHVTSVNPFYCGRFLLSLDATQEQFHFEIAQATARANAAPAVAAQADYG